MLVVVVSGLLLLIPGQLIQIDIYKNVLDPLDGCCQQAIALKVVTLLQVYCVVPQDHGGLCDIGRLIVAHTVMLYCRPIQAVPLLLILVMFFHPLL